MRPHLILVALLFPGLTFASIGEPSATDLATKANRHAESITDAEAFVEEVTETVDLARSGEYGRLKRGDMAKLDFAQEQISELLAGHATAMELRPDDRITVYNAQERITAILRNNDKDRIVCKREAKTGTRLAVTECMTVAEREQRAKVARENVSKKQRDIRYAPEL